MPEIPSAGSDHYARDSDQYARDLDQYFELSEKRRQKVNDAIKKLDATRNKR